MARIRTIKPEFPQSESMGRVSRDARFKKRPIPADVRREVAAQYGASYGEETPAVCEYCGSRGSIYWFPNSKPGWPALVGLEFDHMRSEFQGGKSVVENLVLACLPCNRAKRERNADEWLGRR
jgi:5-methylcytosine-specific restriction endonuclease McrA